VLGLVLGLGAVGSAVGAAVTGRFAKRIGIGRAYALGCLLFTAPFVLVPAAAGPHWLILLMLASCEFIVGFGVMVLDISIGAIFAAVIPNDLRSRVSGAFQAVNYGIRPLGALAGGLLGTYLGIRTTLWIAAAGGTIGFLLLLPGRLPKFTMPELPESTGAADLATAEAEREFAA
jgi:MFS family permease